MTKPLVGLVGTITLLSLALLGQTCKESLQCRSISKRFGEVKKDTESYNYQSTAASSSSN